MADIMVQLQKLANENTAKTFAYNTKEATTSRSWQERMSNTAHQREVKDLIKAGLNPVLSSGGSGAPAYGASSASGTADSAVNAMGNVAASRTSASAMRYSANKNLQAAQAAAAAQRYAADQSAAAQRYAADMNYKTAMDRPANNLVQFGDKMLNKAFRSEDAKAVVKSFSNGNMFKSSKGSLVKQALVKNSSPQTYAKYLTETAAKQMNSMLVNKGYAPTDYNRGTIAMSLQKGIAINFKRLDKLSAFSAGTAVSLARAIPYSRRITALKSMGNFYQKAYYHDKRWF